MEFPAVAQLCGRVATIEAVGRPVLCVLRRAILVLNPKRRRGPWSVLCDNESFLRSAAAHRGHRSARAVLWTMPRGPQT